MAGFDGLTPQQEEFVRRLEGIGTSFALAAPVERESSAFRASFAKAADELDGAARWARSRIEANAGARIGVVVPDLARSRRRVERIFASVLHPDRAIADEAPLAFNISL